MKAGTFVQRVRPVTAVRWDGHADQHPLVRRLATEHDTRSGDDAREIGICQTHYGRRHILSGDYIVTSQEGAVDVVPGNRFVHEFEEVNV